MHVLIATKPITIPGGTIQPGEWLCQDDNAFQLALMAERGTVSVYRWAGINPKTNMFYWDQSKPEWTKSILLIRSGAIGDLLLLTPAIRSLREKYPKASIWLSCFKKHWDVFAQGDTHFIEYPLPVSELAQFDLIISLENIIEQETEKHATDAFAEALGVTVTDYKPVYRVTEEEMATQMTEFGIRDKRIALHLHASSTIRDYPMPLWNRVMQLLVEKGWEIMLIGSKDGITKQPPAIKDCSKLSFREAAAVLSTCDVFCGVDSSFFNLCAALGVPAIGLFGPVNWKTRIKEGSGQRAIHAAECEPCGWTAPQRGYKFPPHGPCVKEQQCVNLSGIRPERIVAVIEKTYEERK